MDAQDDTANPFARRTDVDPFQSRVMTVLDYVGRVFLVLGVVLLAVLVHWVAFVGSALGFLLAVWVAVAMAHGSKAG